ncbi:hypothetical protein SAMN05216323_109310 [Williamwhitmania taraxaci]|uniref:Uncharacterized protein n=1 Tax=Williamwhitmania taraxaci TaxID=1640674 RepID=A0A1G6SF02_9BACT|nr:hypothetical protein SAMN05216323_109310 [Williamwhitmania taraxaci]
MIHFENIGNNLDASIAKTNMIMLKTMKLFNEGSAQTVKNTVTSVGNQSDTK